MGVPYVTHGLHESSSACSQQLSQACGGDQEGIEQHIHCGAGFLSTDVMNIVGAALLGIHVGRKRMGYNTLIDSTCKGAMVNCNNEHWTVFKKYHCSRGVAVWIHVSSICGIHLYNCVSHCINGNEIDAVLVGLVSKYGPVFLHQILESQAHITYH